MPQRSQLGCDIFRQLDAGFLDVPDKLAEQPTFQIGFLHQHHLVGIDQFAKLHIDDQCIAPALCILDIGIRCFVGSANHFGAREQAAWFAALANEVDNVAAEYPSRRAAGPLAHHRGATGHGFGLLFYIAPIPARRIPAQQIGGHVIPGVESCLSRIGDKYMFT